MIRAIPTMYRGTLFRSTLEADWAATLDAYGIDWQYEPEGLMLPSGELYRPDFWLPRIKTWLEVKGLHGERTHKPEELRWAVHCEGGCALGHTSVRDDRPWQMVVVGGAADANGRLRAMAPWVSTFESVCLDCGAWQWSTCMFFNDLDEPNDACRACGAGALDTMPSWAEVGRKTPGGCMEYAIGLVRRRASMAVRFR